MRMTPVTDESQIGGRGLGHTLIAKLAASHFLASAVAAFWLATLYMMGGQDLRYYATLFFDIGETRPTRYVASSVAVEPNVAAILAVPLLLLAVFAVVTGVGLLLRKLWARSWSRLMPVMALPLWVPVAWYWAEYLTLARNGFMVSSDDVSNPDILGGDLLRAALYTLPLWLVVSVVYWCLLRSRRLGEEFSRRP